MMYRLYKLTSDRSLGHDDFEMQGRRFGFVVDVAPPEPNDTGKIRIYTRSDSLSSKGNRMYTLEGDDSDSLMEIYEHLGEVYSYMVSEVISTIYVSPAILYLWAKHRIKEIEEQDPIPLTSMKNTSNHLTRHLTLRRLTKLLELTKMNRTCPAIKLESFKYQMVDDTGLIEGGYGFIQSGLFGGNLMAVMDHCDVGTYKCYDLRRLEGVFQKLYENRS